MPPSVDVMSISVNPTIPNPMSVPANSRPESPGTGGKTFSANVMKKANINTQYQCTPTINPMRYSNIIVISGCSVDSRGLVY